MDHGQRLLQRPLVVQAPSDSTNQKDHQSGDEDTTDEDCTIHIGIMSGRSDKRAECNPSSRASTSRGDALFYDVMPRLTRLPILRCVRSFRMLIGLRSADRADRGMTS